jgi:hypothetical protein
VLKWAKRNPILAILLVVLVCWYFDVRLPSRWAWFDWVWFGLAVLAALLSLVISLFRAMGRLPAASLDWYEDVFLPAGATLAIFVLCSYHASLADRKALAFATLFIPISWGLVIRWLRRRRLAGDMSLALRAPLPHLIIFGLFFACLISQDMYQLIHVSGQAGDLFVHVCARLQSLSGSIWLFLMLVVGIEIRALGCVTFFRFVPWDEIASYEWRQTKFKDLLLLRLNLHNSQVLLQQNVQPAKREDVDRVLTEFLPEGEQSYRPGGEEVRVSRLNKNQLKRLLVFCGAFFFPFGVVLLALSSVLWWLGGQEEKDLVAMLIVGLASTFAGGAALLLSRSEYR